MWYVVWGNKHVFSMPWLVTEVTVRATSCLYCMALINDLGHHQHKCFLHMRIAKCCLHLNQCHNDSYIIFVVYVAFLCRLARDHGRHQDRCAMIGFQSSHGAVTAVTLHDISIFIGIALLCVMLFWCAFVLFHVYVLYILVVWVGECILWFSNDTTHWQYYH